MNREPVLLAGGVVVDGSRDASPRRADVLIEGSRIAAIEPSGVLDSVDGERVDCSGAVVAPGFIDIHTHSDLTRLVYPDATSRVTQGVVTEVIGNCGLSPAPAEVDVEGLRASIGPVDLVPDLDFTWGTYDEFLERLAAAPSAVNTLPLVGHGSVRHGIIPSQARPAERGEVRGMRRLVEEALGSGAWGLSLGLMYAPGEAADEQELTELSACATGRGAIVAAHLRDYEGPKLLDATEEFLRFAGRLGARLQVSHLRSIGPHGAGVAARALESIAEARERGIDVQADAYPYTAGHTTLLQLFPAPLRREGVRAVLAAIDAQPDEAARALQSSGFPPQAITIVRTGSESTEACGRTVADLGAKPDRGWLEAVRLVERHRGSVDVIVEGSTQADVEATLRHPLVVIASDGATLSQSHRWNVPHPRSFGSFPKALRLIQGAGEPLATSIAKATSEPARRMGLEDRGTLRPGAVADTVVFDPELFLDRATYSEPMLPATGLREVRVAGRPVLSGGRLTEERPGRLLLRGQA